MKEMKFLQEMTFTGNKVGTQVIERTYEEALRFKDAVLASMDDENRTDKAMNFTSTSVFNYEFDRQLDGYAIHYKCYLSGC